MIKCPLYKLYVLIVKMFDLGFHNVLQSFSIPEQTRTVLSDLRWQPVAPPTVWVALRQWPQKRMEQVRRWYNLLVFWSSVNIWKIFKLIWNFILSPPFLFFYYSLASLYFLHTPLSEEYRSRVYENPAPLRYTLTEACGADLDPGATLRVKMWSKYSCTHCHLTVYDEQVEIGTFW